MDHWKGRTALITGTSAGIGAGLVHRLTSKGINVIGCARSLDKLQELAKKLEGSPGKFHPIQCDLRQEADIMAMFDVIKKEHGGAVDVCILNAGVVRASSLLDGTTEQWREEWELNVLAPCICAREVLKSMQEKGVDDGHIIYTNSMDGHFVPPDAFLHHYSATKWACRALATGLRQELREIKSNIRVTDICPGFVKTGCLDHLGEEAVKHIYDLNPHLQVEDIADAVEYVLSAPQHVEVHNIMLTHSQDFTHAQPTKQ